MPDDPITPLTDEEFEQWCRDELQVIQPSRHILRVMATIRALKQTKANGSRVDATLADYEKSLYGGKGDAAFYALCRELGIGQSIIPWMNVPACMTLMRIFWDRTKTLGRPEVDALKREIKTDDELLADRNRILEALPCPTHGPCVPYVLHNISDMKNATEHLERALSIFNAAASAKLKHESERLTKTAFNMLYRARALLSSRKDS